MSEVQIVDSGEVVPLPPLLLRPRELAKRLDCSKTWVDSTRAEDRKRLERGEPIKGPPWIKLGFGIRYYASEVDAWVQRTKEAGGKR